jgi:hypothetical protein
LGALGVVSAIVFGLVSSATAWARPVEGTASVTVTVEVGSVGATKTTGDAWFTGTTSRGATIKGHGPITLVGTHDGDTFRVRRLMIKFRGRLNGTRVKGQADARRSSGFITTFTDDDDLIDFVLRGRGSLEFQGDWPDGIGI